MQLIVMTQPCSYAWRGAKGVGKRTQLLKFLKIQANKIGVPFEIKKGTWFLNKQVNGGDPDEDDDPTGKQFLMKNPYCISDMILQPCLCLIKYSYNLF